jgi:SAM-dependent methyltransferase
MKVNRHIVKRNDRIKVTESLLKDVAKGDILELGAGDYSFETNVAKEKKINSWTKVDFDQPCDVICDLNSPTVMLPFEDCKYDLIICTEVLEHLLWPQRVVLECFRVLKINGWMVVSVPNCVSLTYRIAWMLGRIPSCASSGNLPGSLGGDAYEREDGVFVGGHVIDFNLKRFKKVIESAGFMIVKAKGAGIFWRRQLLPHWFVPVKWASHQIILSQKVI